MFNDIPKFQHHDDALDWFESHGWMKFIERADKSTRYKYISLDGRREVYVNITDNGGVHVSA